jgi:nucleoside 2-deoxyribosyltransferase
MKLFITNTFKGLDNKPEIEKLCKIIKQSGWEDYSFVRDAENYTKKFSSSKEMMLAAKKAIDKCDALLFDLTDPSVGKAIEAGIAFQLGKKIIVIVKKDAEKRNTVLGIADLLIEYDQIKDIKTPLANYLLQVKSK